MLVHLQTLGCRLNEAELERWARDFRSAGHTISASAAEADLVVLNTCAVTGEAARQSRQFARRLRRDNPRAKLVVSGCYASLHPQAAAELGVDLVVANQDKDRLVDIARAAFPFPPPPALAETNADTLSTRRRSRAFVKVQDGCRHRCTFCIVTLARGAERSRPIADVVEEIDRLYHQGIQEAVLTGVHLGGYGSDLGSHLGELIQAILRDTRIPRLRLGSLEPWDLPADFFALFADSRLLPHLHLPLQSGSDAVLKRMARRCTSADFARLAEQARARIADVNLTTDIIVGFPGETETDWQATLDVVERIDFGHIHVFAYSARAGTAAARMRGPVDRATQQRRTRELHERGRRLRRATLARFLDRTFPVLWESRPERLADGRLRYFGYTPNYLRVAAAAPADARLARSVRAARLTGIADSGDHALAELLG